MLLPLHAALVRIYGDRVWGIKKKMEAAVLLGILLKALGCPGVHSHRQSFSPVLPFQRGSFRESMRC